MSCYSPLKGYRSKTRSPNGGRAVVFSLSDAYVDRPIEVPCGQCIGCRISKSKQWATRIMHEASQHDHNTFITLTYDENNLSQKQEVVLRHFQLFMKRLRKKYQHKIRFFHVGEYGSKTQRPHYHAILFGHDFSDKIHFKTIWGNKLYTSIQLQSLWPFGYSSIGNVTFQSAAYVSRYIIKKVSGPSAEAHYSYTNPKTGEIHQRHPEYITMSLRPGIGHDWFKKYTSDVYPHDLVVIDGRRAPPPKYYDKLYQKTNPREYQRILNKRTRKAFAFQNDNTPERLEVREEIQIRRAELLERNLDKDAN